jgi:PhoPQ-activated pathogenicity-related protein
MASDAGGKHTVDRFVVAGGSKRGWTTWLTGAVDQRVIGIAPIVIDVLNVEKSMLHHFAAYGFWAPAVHDYVEQRIFEYLGTERMEQLTKLVDPYCYRDRLTMPKFIINASGDQFFLPDSSRFYFDDLSGDKYLCYVPNADHSLDDTDAAQSLLAFYMTVIYQKPRPEIAWEFLPDGAIHVTPSAKPQQVVLWQATNKKARDFRVEEIGKQYQPTVLKPQSDGSYQANIKPAEGWTAYFVEVTFDIGIDIPFKCSTAVRVSPDTLPHVDKKVSE